jgi:hypothetical protein
MYSKRKKQKKEPLQMKIVLILVLIIALFLANASFNMYKRSSDTKEYLSAIEKEYVSLDSQYKAVVKDLEYIQSETGLEREIRSKFDLAREGEVSIVIIEEELPEIQEPKKRNLWEKIVNWVSS